MSTNSKAIREYRRTTNLSAGVGALLLATLCVGFSHAAERSFAALELGEIRGLGMDAAGNLYLPDHVSSKLYRVTPEGEVSVIPTGPSISLFAVTLDDEGTIYVVDTDNSNAYRIAEGGAKRLAPPERTDVFRGATTLDADHEGNLYIGENDANIVRKVTPDGRIEILAGTVGAGGSVDGMGADARFSRPRGLTVDPSGNVYVADEEDSVIRKITPQGMVTTVAGKAGASGDADGAGSEARFAAPKGLAADADGNVYVMDTENHTIRKLTPDGTVTTLAGKAGASGFVDGAAGEARFAGPRAGVVDKQGNLFVADDENGAVRMISPDGRVTTVVAAKPPSSN